MNQYAAILVLVTGQCADLAADWYGIRMKPTKQWQAAILSTGLQKVAVWVPVAVAVWWLGTSGAYVAGAQGAAFATIKFMRAKKVVK